MIITQIELENFMCYAGKDNRFDFTEGLNVVIGDNNYGKSKLYDAFYWALYDQVYVSEQKEFQKTSMVKAGIISDKAKFETEDGSISAVVKITFKNTERQKSYIIERRYTITRKDGVWIERQNSEQTVWQKDLDYLDAKIVKDQETIDKILTLILPQNIKPYMWFQGEQVESIIDFNKQDTLNQAINVLSNITEFDRLIQLSATASKAAKGEHDRQAKLLSKDRVSSDRLEKEREGYEALLSNLQGDETRTKMNLAQAEEKSEALLSKTADANKISTLKERRKSLKGQLDDINSQIVDEEIAFHKRLFKNKWLLKGTETVFNNFSKKYLQYESTKLEMRARIKIEKESENNAKQGLQTRLPIDVPQPIYVQQMLEHERCFVCDREAKEGTEAYDKIKELIERPKSTPTEKSAPLTIHDFGLEFKKLYENGLALSHNFHKIDEDIKDTIEFGAKIKRKARELNKQYEKCEADIRQLLTDASMSDDEADDIINTYAVQNEYVIRFGLELKGIQHRIQGLKDKLADNKISLQGLTKGEIPAHLVEKVTILDQFEALALSTRERVFNNLIERLETEANQHYHSMTSKNKGIRGTIRLVKRPSGNYMPQLEDDNGNKLLQLNTANIILIKLATIMAIISARSGQRNNLYTLITDAPASVFGENYTIGFCKTVSDVYGQSIIMSKEFYKNNDLRKELLQNPDIKLGKVYLITPNITEEERVNRNNLTTQIKPLN